MSDRKRNEGWRADNPNRHKREIHYYTPEVNSQFISSDDQKKRNQKDKFRRKGS